MASLNEPRKQHTIDQHLYDQRLMDDTIKKLVWDGLQKHIMMNDDTMIDKRTGEVWILDLIPHTGKINFKLIFMVFTEHKITYRKVEEIHSLNDISTLGT